VEKLRGEAIRNGNSNWDGGFEILLSFLKTKLLDPRAFSLERLADTRTILVRLADFDDPCLDDEVYDRLGDRVVEYLQHYGSQPHSLNPELHR
jgi:hypothetical protein